MIRVCRRTVAQMSDSKNPFIYSAPTMDQMPIFSGLSVKLAHRGTGCRGNKAAQGTERLLPGRGSPSRARHPRGVSKCILLSLRGKAQRQEPVCCF